MKTKKYKIVIEQEVYSKKSGTKIIKHILLKDSSYEECKEFIKKEFDTDINGFEITVPGFFVSFTYQNKIINMNLENKLRNKILNNDVINISDLYHYSKIKLNRKRQRKKFNKNYIRYI